MKFEVQLSNLLVFLLKIPLHVLELRKLDLPQLQVGLLELVSQREHLAVLLVDPVDVHVQLLFVLLESFLHILLNHLHLSELLVQALTNLLVIIAIFFDDLVPLLQLTILHDLGVDSRLELLLQRILACQKMVNFLRLVHDVLMGLLELLLGLLQLQLGLD